MKTKHILIILSLISALSVSCIREEMAEDMKSSVELTARMEYDVDTKTSLSGLENGGYYPLWSAGDQIAVYADGDADPSKFTLASGEGTTVASFSGSRQGSDYLAVYPYEIAGKNEGGKISLTLPQVQTYVPDSFGQGAFPMIASGDSDGMLKFMNLCSVLKISLTGEAAIRSITVTANDKDTYLSGPAVINVDDSGVPRIIMSEGGYNSLTLKCHALKLNGKIDLYVVIPSQTYIGGLIVNVDVYTETISKVIESDLIFERSQIRCLNKAITVGDSGPKDDLQQRIANEKAALIAFYEALDGDNWYDIWNGTSNEEFENRRWNLHFAEGVNSWYGIKVNDDGLVKELRLPGLNLVGEIPKELYELTELTALQLNNNSLSGSLSSEIKQLTNLKVLSLARNRLSGEIPKELGYLVDLEELLFDDNALTGSFPQEFINLNKLKSIQFTSNMLSGKVPEEFRDWPVWNIHWGMMVLDNKFRFNDLYIPGPWFEVECMNGRKIVSEDVYKANKYTILLQWHGFDKETATPETAIIIRHLKELYDLREDVEIISWANSNIMSFDVAEQFIEYNAIPWDNFYFDFENSINTIGTIPWYPTNYTTTVTVVNTDGQIVFTDVFADRSILFDHKKNHLLEWIDNDFVSKEESLYYSTDYSMDGMLKTLQTATLGQGINIVIMGDAYSDRQIADSTYEADMMFVYENLFSEEPYKTYRELFNVYYVNVVSENEGYHNNSVSALNTGFEGSTLVYGNDTQCFVYAQNAIADLMLDETLVVVVMNSDAYAGTCYMYNPSDESKDYGSGASVAYFPKGVDQKMFAQLLHHEACGHGFAKLADEYAYDYMGEIPQSILDDHRSQQNDWGWWKNVDFTSDVTKVRWANFIEDERYANEGLGAYEGGLTYWTGVWRPTDYSIMRYNTGGFNAPSREAIYYRIHKLAYGDDWEYDYEKFVEYDAINRTSASADAPQKRRANYVEKQYEPLPPPVVVGKTWREAIKSDDLRD